MAELTILGVKVDPAAAKAGVAAVQRAFGKLKGSAATTISATRAEFNKLHGTIFSIRGALVAMGATLFAKDVIATTRDFGAAIADLQAITGASGAALEYLENQARQFGATTTLSAVESAEAFKLIASAKPDLLENVQALQQVTSEVIALSEASGIELPAAASAVGLALNQYSAGAEQAARFVNVLAAGSKYGASEVADTAAAIEKSGVIAKQAGIGFEQLNSLIQILAANGIKGAVAGTQLRGVLLSLQQQGGDLDPKIVGINKSLQGFVDVAGDSTRMTKIFGRENIAAAQILTGNIDSLDKLSGALTDTTVAYDQQRIKTQTLDGDFKRLNSTYGDLKILIGNSNKKELRELVQWITGIVASTSNAIENIDVLSATMEKTWMTSINNVTAAFSYLGAAMDLALNPAKQAQYYIDLIQGNETVYDKITAERKRREKEITEIIAAELAARRENAAREAADRKTQMELDMLLAQKLAADINQIDTDGGVGAVLTEEQLSLNEEIEKTIKSLTIQLDVYGKAAAEAERLSLIARGAEKDQANKVRDLMIQLEGKALTEAMRTPIEKYNEELARLQIMLEANAISQDTLNKRVVEMDKALAQTTNGIQQFADQGARNMQSAFAEFLFDPFENGLDGMLDSFIKTIQRMVAEAAAADILKKLFGDESSGGGLSSVLGGLLGAASSSGGSSGGSFTEGWFDTGTNGIFGPPSFHGSDFTVGGNPGRDKNMLIMPVTRDERVTVTPSGGGGPQPSINVPVSVDARGATGEAAAVFLAMQPKLEERLMSEVQKLLDRHYRGRYS